MHCNFPTHFFHWLFLNFVCCPSTIPTYFTPSWIHMQLFTLVLSVILFLLWLPLTWIITEPFQPSFLPCWNWIIFTFVLVWHGNYRLKREHSPLKHMSSLCLSLPLPLIVHRFVKLTPFPLKLCSDQSQPQHAHMHKVSKFAVFAAGYFFLICIPSMFSFSYCSLLSTLQSQLFLNT